MRAQTLAERQRAAREAFDLDRAIASLPAHRPSSSRQGAAGLRPRAYLKADISEELLRELARHTLHARRCRPQYLEALRIVLGNHAHAERNGYVLELNQRNEFAGDKVMRTIIGQMEKAGISWGCPVSLGQGRTSVIQCLGANPTKRRWDASDEDLEVMYRKREAADAFRREAAEARGLQWPPYRTLGIDAADVPF